MQPTEPPTRRRSDPHAEAAAAWEPSGTLTGADYTSEAVYAVERDRLFHASWVCVGRAEDVPHPGSFAAVDVAGESIVLVRGEDAVVRAFLNVCRHRGSRLCDGAGTAQAIRCPYHAWSYALDGHLLATPNVRRGEQLPRERLGLHPVALTVWEGFVWVSLGDEGTPLQEHLARWASDDPFQWARYGVGELVVGARTDYRVAANWKLLIENYNECLHCPTVHPELSRIVPLYGRGEVEDEPSQVWNGSRLGEGITSFTDRGRSDLPALPGLDAVDLGSFYGVSLLPNLIVNYHSDTVSTFLLQPTGPAETLVTCHYLFRPEVVGAPGFDPAEVVSFRHRLALQDWAVCEGAQRGAGSRGYAAGGILPYADRLLAGFHQRYRALLER